jgi:hypothetical protein
MAGGKDQPVTFPGVRRPAALALAVTVMLLGATACTGDPRPARPAASSSASGPATRPQPAPAASAPFRVAVTRVSGTLAGDDRRVLARNVGRTLSAYVDAAFLAGGYPRSDFADAFDGFTGGAARSARRDQALLTNQRLGPSTESVRALRRRAFLSVLAPYDVAAGVTANVDLDLVVTRSSGPAQRVRMQGRMLLTRAGKGGWSIFGYDLSRSDTPVRSAS